MPQRPGNLFPGLFLIPKIAFYGNASVRPQHAPRIRGKVSGLIRSHLLGANMIWKLSVIVAALGCVWGSSSLLAAPATRPAQAASDLFNDSRVWAIHIQLSADAWKRMQPTVRPRFEPRRIAQTQPATAPSTPAVIRSPMGYEYASVPGTVAFDQEPPNDMAIRFKGNLSYAVSASGLRRPIKIEFNRSDPARRVHGLATLNLNNSSTDPSLLREPLAYAAFRDAGIPAPRTAFAAVYLTVEGLYNRKYIGPYTIVEQVDRAFLERHFGDSSGMLLKPEMLRGIPYLGRHWSMYEDRYNPKSSGNAKATQTFIEFVQLIHFADDTTFRQRIGSFVAIDEFMRFVAIQAMLVNFDSFLTTGHNYYLYQNPRDGKFYWMPWDLDLSFGNFGVVAAPAQQMDLSIYRPHVPPNRLIERLLSIAEFDQKYQQQLRRLAAEVFTEPKLQDRLSSMQMLRRQTRAPGTTQPTTSPADQGAQALRSFVHGRVESIRSQVAGRRDAFAPSQSKDLPLAGVWADTRRVSLTDSALSALRTRAFSTSTQTMRLPDLLAAMQARFAAIASPRDGACDQRTLAEALADVLPVPQNFVFDPGPGLDWAAIVFRWADANQDARLTSEELAAAITRAFADADASKDGALTEAELQKALMHLSAR